MMIEVTLSMVGDVASGDKMMVVSVTMIIDLVVTVVLVVMV